MIINPMTVLKHTKNWLHNKFDETKKNYAVVFALLILLVVNLYLEIGALHSTPFISDEGFAVYMSRAIFAGETPYRNVFLNQPPLTYLYYGFFMQILGWNLYVSRLAAIVLIEFNIVLLFFLARILTRRIPYSNMFALASSALYSLYPSYYGAGLHTMGFAVEEPLLTSFYLLSTIFYAKFLTHEKANHEVTSLILSGFFAGLALMTKLTSVFFIAAVFLFHLILRIHSRKLNILWREVFSFALGMAVLPSIFLLLIYLTGGLNNLFLQLLSHNLYRQQLSGYFSGEILVYLKTFLPIYPLSIIGTLLLLRECRRSGVVLILPVWIYFANLLGFIFVLKSTTTKNLIPLFPFNYLLAVSGYFLISLTLWRTLKSSHRNSSPHKKLTLFSLIAILILVSSLLANPMGELINRAEKSSSFLNSTSLSPIQNEEEHTLINYKVGKLVESITNRSDRIWTSEGAIAFFADRLIIPPRSDAYPYQTFWADQLVFVKMKNFIDSWEADQTKVIVLIRGPVRIGAFTFPYPDEHMWNDTSIREYIESHYLLVRNIYFYDAAYQIWVRATRNFAKNTALKEEMKPHTIGIN